MSDLQQTVIMQYHWYNLIRTCHDLHEMDLTEKRFKWTNRTMNIVQQLEDQPKIWSTLLQSLLRKYYSIKLD